MDKYVTYKINMGLIKSKWLKAEDVVNMLDKPSCVLNRDYVKERNGVGTYTIIYDDKNVGKGIELHFEKNALVLSMAYPATKTDINLLYDSIKTLCNHLKKKNYLKDNNKLNISDLDTEIKKDTEASIKMLDEMKNALYFKNIPAIYEYLAFNPVYLGKEEIDYIDGDLDKYEELLDKLQHMGCTFPSSHIYRRLDGTYYAIYRVYTDERMVLPNKPYLYFDKTYIDDVYVAINANDIVEYNYFIDEVSNKKRYDEKNFIYAIQEKDIEYLLKDGIIDPQTKKMFHRKYFGYVIDDGNTHLNKIYNLGLKVEEEAALNHIAVFLKYAYLNDMLSDELLLEEPKIKEYITDNKDLRELFIKSFILNAKIRIDYFKDEVKPFIANFYKFNCDTGYPSYVDRATKDIFKDDYENPIYQDETYLYTKYDDEYYKVLSKYIDKEYNKYKSLNNKNNYYLLYQVTSLKGTINYINIEKIEIDKKNLFSHIALFIEYFYNKNMIDNHLYELVPELKSYLDNKKDIRVLLLNNKYLDQTLYLEYFKEEVRGFILDYFNFIKLNGSSYIDNLIEYNKDIEVPKFGYRFYYYEYNKEYKKYIFDSIERNYNNYMKK